MKPSEADFHLGDEQSPRGKRYQRRQLAPGDDLKHAPPGSGTHLLILCEHKADQ